MKKLVQMLMPLVAIVAMALPLSAAAQDSCTIRIVGEDSFGDGWNGGTVTVTQSGSTVATFTLSSGYDDSTTVTVTNAPLTITWSAGSYDSEVTLWIYHSSGALLYSATQPTAGTLLSMSNPCSACFAPAGVGADSLASDAARIAWSGDAASYGYLWGTVADMADGIGTSGSTSSTSLDLTGLTSGTGYTVKVWSECSGETSDTVTYTFATLGDPVSDFPYSTGFEADDDIAWTFVNDATNKWFIGAGAASTGTNGLYISNDNGTTNAYTNTGTQFSYAYRVLSVDAATQFDISFSWKAYGEGSYDYIRAWIAPAVAASSLTAGHSPDGGTSAYNYTTATPAGWIDLGGKMNLSSSWQTALATPSVAAGDYILVFMWANDGSGGSQPPAAIDDISITPLTCPMATNLQATTTPDSIIFSWSAGGEETEWSVFIGTDTINFVNDTFYVFDNLTPNTVYNVGVRADCASDDVSRWSNLQVRTACVYLDSLPLVMDFENEPSGSSSSPEFISCWHLTTNATSYYYPYVSSSSSYNHTDGGTKGLYWYRSSTAGSYGDYSNVVLPPLDTTIIPLNTTRITFWAKPSSVSYSPVFYVGVMTDPTVDSTFQVVDTIALPSSTAWAKYTVNFDQFAGTGNYVAIRAEYTGSYWYAYVDDITFEQIPLCPMVEDVNVVSGPVSAMVSWNVASESYTGALVEYKEATADSWNSLTVTDNYAAITGLSTMTAYDLRVSALCGDDPSNAVSTQFSTSDFGCAQLNMATSHFDTVVGTVPTTSYQRPLNNFYRNTFSEQIYDSTELGAAGPIISIGLNYAYSSPMSSKNNVSIYMANTVDTAVSPSNYINPSAMTLVYTGPLNCVTGWNEFQLDMPFSYSGGNLAVAFVDNSNAYDGSAYLWAGHSTNGKAFSYYSDSYMYPDLGSMSTNTDGFRPDMAFSVVECITPSTCAAPLAVVTSVSSSTASLVWAPGNTESSWNVYYRMAGEDNWSAPIAVTATNYTVTGLNSGRNYEFKVEAVCGDENLSSTVSATTLCAAITLPFTENFNNWGSGTGVIPNCWYRTGTYSTYTYISTSYNMTGSTGGSIYMYSSTGSYKSTLILPELDTNLYQANQTQLVFNLSYYYDYYGRPKIEVGVVTNPNDFSTFVPVDTVQHSGALSTWEIFEVPLNAYTGNGAHVAIQTVYDSTYSYFYLDDVTLEVIPTCPRPDSLTASNPTTTTVDVSWHERGSASSWIIEYGPRGFQPGTGTTVVANSNPFTLTGLPVAFQGEYYVKSVCGAGDTGDYSRRPCALETTQIPATLPYNYDFESVTEWQNWQTSTNHATNNWYRGNSVADSGSYAMYIATGDAATYGDYSFNAVVNAAAYRDIDFGPIDSSYTLSFRARVGGTIDNSYDGLMVFLVDPAVSTVASTDNITTPWGNVNDLYRIATVRLDTTWQTYEASFDTISGIHRVAFFWFNQSTASYANIPQPAAVDNIHIKYSSCVRPLNMAAVPSTTSALITWDGAADGTYQVTYRRVGDSVNSHAIANTNSLNLTGLISPANYVAWVRKICGAGDTSLYADGVAFTTLCSPIALPYVEDFNSVTATTYSTAGELPLCWEGYSNGTNDSYFPHVVGSGSYWYSNDNTNALTLTSGSATYGDTKVVALPILAGPVNTCTMSFYYRMESTSYGDLEVGYLTGYDLALDFVPVDTMPRTSTITLDSVSFAGVPSDALRIAFRWTHDASFYSVGIDSIVVNGENMAACNDPVINLTATVVNENDVTISFSGDAELYEVGYVQGNTWVEPATTVNIADTFYTFTGLTAETEYTFGVRALCSETNLSGWSTVTLTTLEHPCFTPSNVAVSNATYDGATVTWTPGENETEWEVNISCTSPVYNQTFTVSGTPQYVATGLDEGVTYKVAVRGVCAPGRYSDWSDTVDLATMGCDVVTGLTKTSGDAHSVTISWTSTGASKYEVDYGDQGHTDGNGTIVETTTNSITINGLESESTYDIYVRQYCTETLASQWSSMLRITTTAEQGIDDVESARVTLYPNPASQMVTIGGIEGEATVSIVDMNGREVYSTNSASESLTLDLTGYAKGAYFVRITGERTQAIRKLIVK